MSFYGSCSDENYHDGKVKVPRLWCTAEEAAVWVTCQLCTSAPDQAGLFNE